MKKTLILSLLLFCFSATTVFAADANEEFKKAFKKIDELKKQGISYTVNSVTGKKNKKSVNAKVYMKGDKIRIDANGAITIMDGDDMYVYSEQEKTAMKMNVNSSKIKESTFDI